MRVSSVTFQSFAPAPIASQLWNSTKDHRCSPALPASPVRPSALLPQQMGCVCVPFRPGRLHRRHEPPKISGTSHPDHSVCLLGVCSNMCPQFDRGGGALCLQNLGTFGLFSAAVTSYYSCCSDSSCSNVCPRVLPASTSAPSVSASPPNVAAQASLFIFFILHALFLMA